jgi:hypothetical protein
MIAEMEARVRARIKEGLYGADRDTLEDVVMQTLQKRNWSLAIFECGLNGNLYNRLKSINVAQENVRSQDAPCELPELLQHVQQFRTERQAQAGLGISLQPGQDKQMLFIVVITPENAAQFTRSFGGERALSNPWSINTGLEMLRRAIEL